MKKALFYIFFLTGVFTSDCLQAQDPHLSQFFQSPVFQNPANIGRFDGKVRLQGHYRQQWTSMAHGFVTSSAHADFRLANMGVAVSFIDDNAGTAGLTHTNALLGFGYHKDFLDMRHRLSVGAQMGFIQKGFDPVALSFGNQWDPDFGFDGTLPSGENLFNTQLTVADINSGFAYTYKAAEPKILMGAHLGLSFAHITQPNISFFNAEGYLPMKTTAFAELDILSGERIQIRPSVLYARQGTAREIIAGGRFQYELDQEVFFHAGAYYRLQDALIPYVGLSFNGMDVGFSYDVNLSTLSQATNLRGGFELSIAYIWNGEIKPKTNYEARNVRSLRDQDGDGIKDGNDKCPDIPGLRRYGGCPDSDGDGIVDEEDLCPTQPGPKERNGCPAKDRDGDGVLDATDACPDTPGLIAFKGCPDSDNDGLPDDVDKCPHEAGPRARSGCPSSDIDADGDGIPDKIDLCPTLAGPAELQGCPDKDQDGISDFEDVCPDVPGEKIHNGCPTKTLDSDGDGILDPQDKCPMVAGLPQFSGCPDTDKDGINDFEDKCPLTPGLPQNQGCPTQNMDADGDGIMNSVDRCPYVPGLQKFQGCPDSDNDGISDLDDKCPTIYGSMANAGCPVNGMSPANPSMPASTHPSFGPIEFDTDQAVIKAFYFDMLDQLAEYMRKNPQLKLLVAGHTDNEGDQMYNMVLGQNRSKAIKYYLISRGVAPERISELSYGEIMPKKENNTAVGKARNRRAELILAN
ncbi:MAG: PorP/SprF family type IX secretion system membrane protein [Bacteroidota bacterium]